jgi:hypothetical protein
MYSVSRVFRLIQYRREGEQLNFHISRHIAHLGWGTPVVFLCISYLVYIWPCRMKLFQCFHIQMVVVPILGYHPSAVMFFKRFLFSAKKFRQKYSERIWVFHS